MAIITSGATIAVLMAPGVLGQERWPARTIWSTPCNGHCWPSRLASWPPGSGGCRSRCPKTTRAIWRPRGCSPSCAMWRGSSPAGLDAVSLGAALLDDLRDRHGITRGWVFGYRAGGVPVALASGPSAEFELVADLSAGTPWSRVIDEGRALAVAGALTTDTTMRGAIVPMRIRDTLVGLVAVERRGQRWSDDELTQLSMAADADAVRLEAALLFDEVRSWLLPRSASAWLARSMTGLPKRWHPLGISSTTSRHMLPPRSLPSLLRFVRSCPAIVTELRFSIFDLRKEIGPGASLTSVLADHARHVGETAGIAVHLELSESPARLRPAVESEILRIAQEAIANARRHSRARNLWITCVVDAPEVFLRVEDDGRGLLPPRDDSFGLSIMQERADRAGCRLSVIDRPGGGTSVEVQQHTAGQRRAAAQGTRRDSEHDDSRSAR